VLELKQRSVEDLSKIFQRGAAKRLSSLSCSPTQTIDASLDTGDRRQLTRRTAMELAGQVAIVTGAGRGIGRATALELARLGANIVIAEVDRANAERTAVEVQERGRQASVIPTDVTSRPGAWAPSSASQVRGQRSPRGRQRLSGGGAGGEKGLWNSYPRGGTTVVWLLIRRQPISWS
jgi:hypothetical protein